MRDLQLAFISNRTTSRLFRLLNVIERNPVITIGELAEKMQVTERTIVSDIKYIRNYFVDCIDLSSGNSGYFFDLKKTNHYQEKKRNLLENECLFEIIEDIFFGKLSRVDELAYRYHFSESTFRRLLGQTTYVLESYGLQWVSNPLNIKGKEVNLRKFFKDFYYEGGDTPYTLVPDSELYNLILRKIGNKLGHHDIGTGSTPAAFFYTLYITIKRASLGFSIEVPEHLSKLAYEGKSFSLLFSLKDDIEDLYDTKLGEEEFAWIYLDTVCKRTLDQEESEEKFYARFNQGSEVAQITDDYLKNFEESNNKQNTKIRTFLRSFFLSRKINHLLTPVLNKEAQDIKEAVLRSDMENFHCNLNFLKSYRTIDFLSDKYLEDICVSLTLYSDLIFDFYTPAQKIFFLLEGDHFVCQQIQTRAINQFGNKHTLTFLPSEQITREMLSSISVELIVTNYSNYLSEYKNGTKFFMMNPLPYESDWIYLEKIINPYRKKFF